MTNGSFCCPLSLVCSSFCFFSSLLHSFNLDGNLAVAHGNGADIYDLRSLDNGPLTRLTNHAKTVTCLATCDKGSRLLTGSVDQTVKGESFFCILFRVLSEFSL